MRLERGIGTGIGPALVVALLAVGVLSAFAATATAATKPPRLSAADRNLFLYAACMRKKGVEIPNPVRGKNGRYAFPKIPAKVLNAPGVKKKAAACAAQLPRLVAPNRLTPAQRAAFKRFSDCMAKNGVKLGRPTQQRPPAGQRPPSGPSGGFFFNSSDPKVKKALAKCQKYRPKVQAG